MTDIVIAAVILVIIAAAAGYVIRAKKSGVKCIGCPSADSCPHNRDCAAVCGCHTDRSLNTDIS